MANSDIQVWTVEKPHITLDCQLGEGPFFEEATQTVRFVDIFGKKLHRFHIDKGQASLESYDTGDAVGVTFDIESDDKNAIVGAKYGYALMDKATGKLKYIARAYDEAEEGKRMRFNDGNIDPTGRRFLAGTMTDPAVTKPVVNEGTLFCLDSAKLNHNTSSNVPANAASSTGSASPALSSVLHPVAIPNGLGWTSNGRTMLHTDSPTKSIRAFDYDTATGKASNQRPWFEVEHFAGAKNFSDPQIPPQAGPPGSVPDGFTTDEGGDVWTAVYGAGKVLRVREIEGKAVVVGVVKLPAANITCPRFVGEDLVITSAQGPGEFGGCVFRVRVGVRGPSATKWIRDA